MAASDRQIKRDAAGQPTPQVFDEVADEYQVAKGTQGRQHAILYTADGEPVDLAALVADMAAAKAALAGTLTTQVAGGSVNIDGTDFAFDGPRTIYGLASNRPAAAAAHAVVPFGYYVAADTGTIAQTDGTNWVEV